MKSLNPDLLTQEVLIAHPIGGFALKVSLLTEMPEVSDSIAKEIN